MVARDQLTQINDGDQLNDGYFNEIGTFYVETRDNSSSDITHDTGVWTKKRTFTFSGLSPNYVLRAIEVEGIDISCTNVTYPYVGKVGFIITDGSNYWTTTNISEYTTSLHDAIMPCVTTTTSASPGTFLSGTTTNTTLDYSHTPAPMNLVTGATSYDVEVYLQATGTSNTATLVKGFTIRLIFDKRVQDLGTSTSQS